MNALCENLAQYAHGMTTMFFVFIAISLYEKRRRDRLVFFLLVALLVVWSLVMMCHVLLGQAVYYLCSIAVFTYIYFQTLRHHVVPIEEPRSASLDEPKEAACIATKLARSMEQERMFLNPLLTLREVACAIGTNRTYLSEYLNRDLKTNFYDYVNSHRIAEAEKLLLNDRTLKIEDVSAMCGFNSLSTFLRSFEKCTGTTPTKFKARH